jgi:hypothetical protein
MPLTSPRIMEEELLDKTHNNHNMNLMGQWLLTINGLGMWKDP